MPTDSELCLIRRSKIITMLQCGKTKKDIMEEVGCTVKTIDKWAKRYAENGQDGLTDKRKTNHGPRKTSAEEDELFLATARDKPFQSVAKSLEESQLNISVRTGQKRLRENDIINKPTAKKNDLNDEHRRKRIQHARDHLNWTQNQWDAVIWSDEKSFKSSMDNRRTVWRPRGERLNPKYVVPNWRSNRISSMFWGCMSGVGLMDLVQVGTHFNAQDYIEVLENVMLPAARRVFPVNQFPQITFMHDNSPVHTAGIVRDWFNDHDDIVLYSHPPMSPDLNPIENIWGLMDQKWSPANRPKTIIELNNYTEQLWNELKDRPDFCRNIVNSMNRRMQEVLEKDGYWTKY